MKIEGYKLSGYDATYRKAVFNVNERGNKNRVLEITEVESGQTFLLDLKSAEKDTHRIGTWRKDKVKGHGKHLHFGKAGFFEQIKKQID